eukprot:763521-Hanusia_phi.AAC.11
MMQSKEVLNVCAQGLWDFVTTVPAAVGHVSIKQLDAPWANKFLYFEFAVDVRSQQHLAQIEATFANFHDVSSIIRANQDEGGFYVEGAQDGPEPSDTCLLAARHLPRRGEADLVVLSSPCRPCLTPLQCSTVTSWRERLKSPNGPYNFSTGEAELPGEELEADGEDVVERFRRERSSSLKPCGYQGELGRDPKGTSELGRAQSRIIRSTSSRTSRLFLSPGPPGGRAAAARAGRPGLRALTYHRVGLG